MGEHLTEGQRQQYRGRIRYWCEDETRVGLFTVQHRKLTGFGVKPVGIVQWQFLYRWLYGFVEPQSGASWFMEFSHLDGACFEVALAHFAAQFPQELHVIQLDNAKAHQADSLNIPDNVVLLFQPPYCPEVNPIERLWQELKRALAWMHFESIAQLQASHYSMGEPTVASGGKVSDSVGFDSGCSMCSWYLENWY